jgi:geranylgeranyl pyrophosphate synthase
MLELALQRALKNTCRDIELFEVMSYAVLPAGKLFRPKLVEALALDLNKSLSNDQVHLATAIELHHAYTLVHDDLPAMDNDLFRRGKPSTHAQFGEWKAILAGDALLISSFDELNKINHFNYKIIHKLMSWATGAKGLILGQFKDLSANGNLDISSVVRIHELKTGRLIQIATLGTYLLTEDINLRGKIDFLKLGKEIGVCFQLLDDLSELTSPKISPHEIKINPFIYSKDETLKVLVKSHSSLQILISKYKLTHLDEMLKDYFLKNQKMLLENFEILESNLRGHHLNLKKWITSFV